MNSLLRTLLIFLAICVVLALVFRGELAKLSGWPASQTATVGIEPDALTALYGRLKIEPLNPRLLSEKVGRALKDLSISFCDKTAIYRFSKGMVAQGERKPAATALLAFADSCPNAEGERYLAANILYGMGDYAGVLKVADDLVGMRPEVGQYHYTRGEALSALARHEEAIAAYTSALALVDDLLRVNSRVFMGLASAYAKTGQFCQAMTAIQTFVHAEPLRRDTAQTRSLVSDYAAKGNCKQSYASGSAIIPRTRSDVTIVRATVNGVKGSFLLDTGASLVALAPQFAERMKASAEPSKLSLVVHTANGVTRARLTTLESVEVEGVRAEKVSAAILSNPIGPGIDGLLGMSFLARFDVALESKAIKISERDAAKNAEAAK